MDKRVGRSVGEGGGEVKAWSVYGLAAFRRADPEVLMVVLGVKVFFYFSWAEAWTG